MSDQHGARVAVNDYLIDFLLDDPNYKVLKNGSVYRRSGKVWKRTGNATTFKSGKYYRHLKYKKHNLVVHRIIYRKYHGPLDELLVVNHIDGNSLNNAAWNLELITQSSNIQHRYTPSSY